MVVVAATACGNSDSGDAAVTPVPCANADQPADGKFPDFLCGSFGSAPTAEWTLDWPDICDRFDRDSWGWKTDVDGEVGIVKCDDSLVAIDLDNGSVRWSVDPGDAADQWGIACADRSLDGLVVCASDNTLRGYRLTDGELVEENSSVGKPDNPIFPLVRDGSLYTYFWAGGGKFLTRGTIQDPGSDWRVETDECGDSDARDFRVLGDSVVAYGALYSTADGARLTPAGTVIIRQENHDFAMIDCAESDDDHEKTISIIDDAGRTLRTHRGLDARSASESTVYLIVSGSPDQRTNTAYDSESGEQLWSTTDSIDGGVFGDVLGWKDGRIGDARTGEIKAMPTMTGFEGQFVDTELRGIGLCEDDDAITTLCAVDLKTGQSLWETPPIGSSVTMGRVYRAGQGIVVRTNEQGLAYYPPQ